MVVSGNSDMVPHIKNRKNLIFHFFILYYLYYICLKNKIFKNINFFLYRLLFYYLSITSLKKFFEKNEIFVENQKISKIFIFWKTWRLFEISIFFGGPKISVFHFLHAFFNIFILLSEKLHVFYQPLTDTVNP